MEKPSIARIGLKWSFISAVLSIIYTIIYYKTVLIETPILSWLTFIFLLFGVILSIKEFKTLNNDVVSFNDGLSVGTLMSAITGLIYQLFSYVYNTFIDSSIAVKMANLYKDQLISQGLSPEKVISEMEYASTYTTPGFIFIQGIILHILFGFVFSLIVSAMVRSSKPEVDF